MRSKRQVNWKGKNRIPSKAATPTYSKNDCFKVPKNELSTEPKNVASNYRTGVSTEIAARAKTLRIMIFFANLGKVIFTTRTQSTRRIINKKGQPQSKRLALETRETFRA